MDRIKEITEELAAAIIETNVFSCFEAAREKINEDELKKINSYKCLKAKLINEYSAETENEANKLYSDMMPNSHTREYIQCEKRLLVFVADIYDEIGQKLMKK
ncbi:MAG: YlbF family regulator [Candidatus Metalachnospira sp.]|nr:YlbF family regulator [Candidatus Metalachnospira sp.]